MHYLDKPIKLMVCGDGIVTILGKHRRLNSSLPFYSCNSRAEAIVLIKRICLVVMVDHGKRVGTLLEFKAPNFVSGVDYTFEAKEKMEELTQIFKAEEASQQKPKGLVTNTTIFL